MKRSLGSNEGSLAAFWVWVKIKQEGLTQVFGPCFHLQGNPFRGRFLEPPPLPGNETSKMQSRVGPVELSNVYARRGACLLKVRTKAVGGVKIFELPPSNWRQLLPHFLREGSPTKIDDRRKSWYQMILSSQIWRTQFCMDWVVMYTEFWSTKSLDVMDFWCLLRWDAAPDGFVDAIRWKSGENLNVHKSAIE